MYRLLCLLVLVSFNAWSQSGGQVLSRMEKKNWEKAAQTLAKGLQKDTANVELRYVASLLYFHEEYPEHHVDSAYFYARAAIKGYQQLTVRDKEKIKRFPIDSAILLNHKIAVEKAAFAQAKVVNTETAYQHFLAYYPASDDVNAAVELRDEVAFLEALKVNTYTSFDAFLKRYPSSHRAADAQKRYDKLVYDHYTKDELLKSYEAFVQAFPASPYRSQAEYYIMQIATASGAASAFTEFIQHYPQSRWSDVARNMVFHLESATDAIRTQIMTDSLRKAEALSESYWVPFLKNGRYGFMNAEGAEQALPPLDDIDPEYLCGDLRTDVLITSQGVMSRSGKLLFKGNVEEVTDLGDGFLKIDLPSSSQLIHKSGFSINGECKAVHIVANRFIAVQKESGWGVLSFTGKVLLPYVYEEIAAFDDWIVLTKSGKKIVVTADQVGHTANKMALPETMAFDEVRRWGDKLCWVRNGALEGVLNERLEFIIPLDRQILVKTPFGFIRQKGSLQLVEGIAALQNVPFSQVIIQGQWMLAQQPGTVQLFNIPSSQRIVTHADSIWLDKNVAMVKVRDSVYAWLNKNTHVDYSISDKATLFSRDSSAWMLVAGRNNSKSVYDAITGTRLFTSDFDQVEHLMAGFFLLTKANKKGVIDAKGKIILPIEYDAIIQSEPGRLSLLKDKKFGLYDLTTRQLIRPLYERNLIQYNRQWMVAFKEGGWGFMDSNAKPVGKFQFNEVKFWNDTAAWVKENFQWKIYAIKSGKVLQDKIKDFRYVKQYPHEHVVIIHQDNYYGVMSNRSGVIIPSTFTDIVNVGDADKPMYFTEKHIEEADISVVIYYNHEGKLLRRQAFESADEYERIYCGKR